MAYSLQYQPHMYSSMHPSYSNTPTKDIMQMVLTLTADLVTAFVSFEACDSGRKNSFGWKIMYRKSAHIRQHIM